jgi:hypothetical protein
VLSQLQRVFLRRRRPALSLARSRYYADTFRTAQINLRVGPIETWWSYDQFAKRGMDPVACEAEGERDIVDVAAMVSVTSIMRRRSAVWRPRMRSPSNVTIGRS